MMSDEDKYSHPMYHGGSIPGWDGTPEGLRPLLPKNGKQVEAQDKCCSTQEEQEQAYSYPKNQMLRSLVRWAGTPRWNNLDVLAAILFVCFFSANHPLWSIFSLLIGLMVSGWVELLSE